MNETNLPVSGIDNLPSGGGVEFLYSLEKFGVKMDLENIRSLVSFASHPERTFKVVHVAGTNGKGSTCAMIASALIAQGYRVGLYTSPHVLDFSERIKIGDVQIPLDSLEALTDFFRQEIVRLRATFFEATTAIMFKYFADEKVDVAVVETGLGGRLDATNIVTPLVSVITGIGLDHTEVLGDTVEKIALEKAGIIKEKIPAIVNVTGEELKNVFREVSRNLSAPLEFVQEVVRLSGVSSGLEECLFDAVVSGVEYKKVRVSLGGLHQVQNATTAILALQALNRSGVRVSKESIYHGLSRINENTGHRGRMEIVSRNPLIIVDVAHNPDGARVLSEALEPLSGRRGILLFGAMRDKDSASMLNTLRKWFDVVILCQLQIGRSLSIDELKKLSDDINLSSQVFSNSSDALASALGQLVEDRFLLIAGSHYLAGEIVPNLQKYLEA